MRVILCLVVSCFINVHSEDYLNENDNVVDYSRQDLSSPNSASNEILNSEEKEILNNAFKDKSFETVTIPNDLKSLNYNKLKQSFKEEENSPRPDDVKPNPPNITENSNAVDFDEYGLETSTVNEIKDIFDAKKRGSSSAADISDEIRSRASENIEKDDESKGDDKKEQDDYDNEDNDSRDDNIGKNKTEGIKLSSTQQPNLLVRDNTVTASPNLTRATSRYSVTRVHDSYVEMTNSTINILISNIVDSLESSSEKQNLTKSGSQSKLERKNSEENDNPASTTLLNYPFVVSIQKRGSHYATGALLSKKWVLSVAGEFYNVRESLKLFRLRCGSVDNKRGGILVPLKKVVIHPSYIPDQPNYDLSMIMVGKSIKHSDVIKPISVSKLTSKVVGGKFLTTYWPRIMVKGEPLPSTARERTRHNSLRVSTQKMIPPVKCNKMMVKTNTNLDDSTLCLKPFVSHHTICVPDAGAPVIGEDGIWGITSGWTSKDCLKSPSPYVFTRLSSAPVRSWINEQLHDIKN